MGSVASTPKSQGSDPHCTPVEFHVCMLTARRHLDFMNTAVVTTIRSQLTDFY